MQRGPMEVAWGKTEGCEGSSLNNSSQICLQSAQRLPLAPDDTGALGTLSSRDIYTYLILSLKLLDAVNAKQHKAWKHDYFNVSDKIAVVLLK